MFTTADIEKYFNGEKQESLLFMLIGIAGIIAAIVFLFFLKSNFYKGVAVPLILIGLMLGVVGFAVYKRSDEQRIRNVYAYTANPYELKAKELPRMEKVMKNFALYRWTEIAFLVIGILMFYYFRRNADKQFWAGLAAGLIIMSVLALFADYFAEKRGKIYIEGIKSFVNK